MTVTLSPLQIDCDFDSGNIQVLDASNPAQVHLAIRPDSNSGHFQWFHFKVSGLTPGQVHRFSLDNASESSYKQAWAGYNAVASYDQQAWFRVPSQFDGKALSFEVNAEQDQIWFAYFEPYPRARHNQLIERAKQIPGVELLASGQLDLTRVITRVITLDQAVAQGFEALLQDKSQIKVIVGGER